MVEATITRCTLESLLTLYDEAGQPQEHWLELHRLRDAHVIIAADVDSRATVTVAGESNSAAIDAGEACPDPGGWRILFVECDDQTGSPDGLRLLCLLHAVRERWRPAWRPRFDLLGEPLDFSDP